MKRIGLIGVCLGFGLLLTGCGDTRELTCSRSEEDYYATMVEQYHFTYKSEALEKVDQGIQIEMAEDYSTLLSSYADTLEEEVREMNSDTIKANFSVEGNKLIVTASYNFSDLSEEELETVGYEEEYASYDSAKTELESQGYVCE